MCASTVKSTDSILLFDVPWEAYEGLVDALPDHRVPHTYQEGTLELFKTVWIDVPWEAYEEILKAFGNRRFPHTYQDGTLEIMMSPSEDHEQIKSLIGRLIEVACLELKIHFKAVGAATRRNKKLMQGLEPDESYYIPYVPDLSSKIKRETEKKRSPNLAIEIDLRKPAVARMKTYAKLGIRELWRYRKRKVEFFGLSGTGKYKPLKSSIVFPMIGPDDVARFIGEMQVSDDYVATQSFLAWLKKQITKSAAQIYKKET
jgi:Uma2 family endonuclease